MIWVILLGALLLRVPQLNGSFWLDEAAQALESARPLAQQFEIVPDFQPPLFHLIVHFALVVSDSEWWLRLMSAIIPGLVTIWLVYDLSKKMFSQRVAVWAAALLSTSSLHIFYSQELRPYSLPAMWAVLSWWFLQSAVKKVEAHAGFGSRYYYWVGFTAVNILGLYSSYLYPFLVLSQMIWVLWQERASLPKAVISGLVLVLSFLPWLPILSQQLTAGGEVRTGLPGWEEVVSIPQLKSLPLVLGKFVFGVLNLDLNPWYVGVAAITGVLTVLVAKTVLPSLRKKSGRELSLVLCWLILPLLTSWIVSFWIPVIQPKRVLFLLPAFYLLIATLVTGSRIKRWQYLPLICLLGINVFSSFQYYLQPSLQREDWRGLYQQITQRYPAKESIGVFVFPEPFAPWRWYNQLSVASFSTGAMTFDQSFNLEARITVINNYKYVLVFDYLRDLTDPDDEILKAIEVYGYEPIDLFVYPNIGWVRVYSKKEFKSA